MQGGVRDVYPIAFILLFLTCNVPKDSNRVIPISEYSFASKPQLLAIANDLRNSAKFEQADSAYHHIQKTSLDEGVREFALLNQFICKLAANDTLYFDTLLYSTHYPELSKLVNGILLTRKDQSGFKELHSAVGILKKKQLHQSFYYFVSIEQLGLAHRQKISYWDSTKYYYEQASTFLKQLPALAGHQARVLFRLAKVSPINRDYISAISLVDQALAIDTSVEFSVPALAFRAGLLRQDGRMEESEATWKEAYSIAQRANRSNHLKFEVMNERVLYAISIDDHQLFQSSLKQLQDLAPAVQNSRKILSRLQSRFHYLNQQYEEAIKHSQHALNHYTHERLPDSKMVFEALHILGDSFAALEKFEEAKEYAYRQLVFTTSLKNSRFSFTNAIQPEVQADSYNFVAYDLLGGLYIKEFKKNRTRESLNNAIYLYTLIDSLMATQVRAHEEEAVFEFAKISHPIYSNGIETCYLLNELSPNTKWINMAHRFMERSKSFMTYQDIRKHDQNFFPSVPKAIRERELALRAEVSKVKRSTISMSENKLTEALEKQETFLQMLSEEYPAFYNARYTPSEVDVKTIHLNCEKGKKSLLNYHYSGDQLFAIRYDGSPEFKLLPLPKNFGDSIARFRSLLSKPNSRLGQFKKLSHSFFQILIQPFGNLREQLEVVPDGILSHLPFETLVTDTSGSEYQHLAYLIKKHAIQYRLSLKSTQQHQTDKIETIIGYAHAIDDPKLPYLAGSVKELDLIESIFTSARVDKRGKGNATRNNFLNDLEREVDLIHVGLHATADPADRLKNAIYFKANNRIDTVFGFEMAAKFIRAHTVVLTSCETALGEIIPGEGSFSLTRSILQTGVDTVVASLWSLPDQSSPLICSVFYQKIKAGWAPALALRESKIGYLKNGNRSLAEPFFWAGLTCSKP